MYSHFIWICVLFFASWSGIDLILPSRKYRYTETWRLLMKIYRECEMTFILTNLTCVRAHKCSEPSRLELINRAAKLTDLWRLRSQYSFIFRSIKTLKMNCSPKKKSLILCVICCDNWNCYFDLSEIICAALLIIQRDYMCNVINISFIHTMGSN